MDPLPHVKAAFSIDSREESLQKEGPLSSSSSKTQASTFVGKFSDQKKNF